jgi:hypothetical protein
MRTVKRLIEEGKMVGAYCHLKKVMKTASPAKQIEYMKLYSALSVYVNQRWVG